MMRDNNNQAWPSKWKCLHVPYNSKCFWNAERNKCLPNSEKPVETKNLLPSN